MMYDHDYHGHFQKIPQFKIHFFYFTFDSASIPVLNKQLMVGKLFSVPQRLSPHQNGMGNGGLMIPKRR